MKDFIEKLLIILAIFAFIAVFACIVAVPVLFLWNALMPVLFGLPVLTYWQAYGLYLLCLLLFGKSSGSSSRK